VVTNSKAAEHLRSLTGGKEGDRRKAARELKNYNMSAVVEALLDSLRRDESDSVRKEAATSLGEMKAREAQPALRLASRQDDDSGVRKAALKSAQKIEQAFGIRP
jgi:HEAT repeat protein